MQKIIATIAIIVSLFLVGCYTDTTSIELGILSKDVRDLQHAVQDLQSLKFVKTQSTECVIFMRGLDSHAIISYATIPIDGRYYVSSWDHMAPRINYYKSGTIIQMPQDIIRDTCPQFKVVTKGIEK